MRQIAEIIGNIRSHADEELEERLLSGWIQPMSDTTAEIIAACEALPSAKQAGVADFAKFLLAQEGDARWEEIINDPQPRRKLQAFIENAIAEGSGPLDLDRI